MRKTNSTEWRAVCQLFFSCAGEYSPTRPATSAGAATWPTNAIRDMLNQKTFQCLPTFSLCHYVKYVIISTLSS